METIVELIDRVLQNPEDEANLEVIGKEVHQLMAGHDLFNY
jgi:glycine/serine hydroxymethyltransferase